MGKRLLVVLALIFILGSNVRAAEKFAYINLEKVFNEYQKTKDEEAKLTEEGKQKQKEIDAKIKEIDKLREDMELLNEKEKEKRKAEIEKKMQELRQFDRQARADLMRKRDAIIREILTEIDNAIKEYGKSKGYTLIFNSRALLYKDEKLDITDEIIKYLNNKYKKEKVK
jgi:outer membrane protein